VLNVGFGELLVLVLVCLVVFGPERLPEVARQLGRFVGRIRLTTQRLLDELKNEAELRELNLPDLQVGSLRAQARTYVQDLMDVEGQMAEMEREDRDRERRPTGGAAGAPPPFDPDAT
jgi:sec-independent protein translocase protein TatB